MKIENLNVDTRAIAAGIYDIIVEQCEEHLVAFGMLPKHIIDLLEKQTRDKLLQITADYYQVSVEEFLPFVDKAKLETLVSRVVHACSVDIYAVAKERGAMVV